MTILGIVFFVIGTASGLAILQAVGLLLASIGVIVAIVGALDKTVGGRKHIF